VIFCWLFGHRYDYDIKKPEMLALVCTRCGDMRVLIETRAATSPPLDVSAVKRSP
jgi:hypothetical protein